MDILLNPTPHTVPKPEQMAPCLSASISLVLPVRYKSFTQDFFPNPPVRFVPLAATVILLVCPPAPPVRQVRTIPRPEAQLANSALPAVTVLWANRPVLHVLLDISALPTAPSSAPLALLASFAPPQDQVEGFRAKRATTAPLHPPFKPPVQQAATARHRTSSQLPARKTRTARRRNRRPNARPAPRENKLAPVQSCALPAFPALLTPRLSAATPLKAKSSSSWRGACVYL